MLGHSWGGASAGDWQDRREEFARRRPADDHEVMQAIAATAAFQRGELEAEGEYNRAHFRMTVRRQEQLERLVARLRAGWTAEGVLLARAIGERLHEETAPSAEWDLSPALRKLDVPTLPLHGVHDFIPVELAERIADAVPDARLSVLLGVGHFTFLEAPEPVHDEISRFCC